MTEGVLSPIDEQQIFKASQRDYYRNYAMLFTYIYESQHTQAELREYVSAFNHAFPEDPAVQMLIESLGQHGDIPSLEGLLDAGVLKVSYRALMQDNPSMFIPTLPDALRLLTLAAKQNRALQVRQELNITLEKIGEETAETFSAKLVGWADILQREESVEVDYSPAAVYDRRKTQEDSGVYFYVAPLDEVTGSLSPGSTTIVGGFAGSGKTQFVLNMLYQNAVSGKRNCTILTLEMSKDEYILYLLSRHSRNPMWNHIPYARIDKQLLLSGNLSEEQERFVKDTLAPDLFENPERGKIVILGEEDIPIMTPDGIKHAVWQACPDTHMFFLDYTNVFKAFQLPFKGYEDPKERVNYFIKRLDLMARSFYRRNIHVVMVSQLNREGYKQYLKDLSTDLKKSSTSRGYNEAAFKDANENEASAWYLVSLFSNEDMMERGIIDCQLLKHRGGAKLSTPFPLHIEPQYAYVGNEGDEDYRRRVKTGELDLEAEADVTEFWFGDNVGGDKT